ncbi:MAG: helix-hairpin-helix domain-containing protein [Candidatus Omnitrophota bacterium]
MKLNKSEKIVFVALAALLFLGAATLHVKHLRSRYDVAIITDGAGHALTLEEAFKAHEEARKVDINNAAIKELVSVPGIGEVLASRIIAGRKAQGRFYRVDDLLRIKGIGEKKLAMIRKYLKTE